MTEERPASRDTSEDLPLDDVIEVQGDALPIDQDAVIDADEMERARPATRTELDRGDPMSDDLREGETNDPDVAAEEGLVYVPPSDPPVRSEG